MASELQADLTFARGGHAPDRRGDFAWQARRMRGRRPSASRIDRLRELVDQDAPEILLEEAHNEVGRSLVGLSRPGRAQGEPATEAAPGESPPGL